jgi:hypothetical protein
MSYTVRDLYSNGEAFEESREVLRRLPNGEVTIR